MPIFNQLTQRLYHPATTELLRNQFRAKLSRIANAFSNPKRKLLAIVALVLGGVWLSQAIASVMFRQSADPEQLKFWLPLGLFTYSAWHIFKISTRKSVEPFEWTPAEQELVCAAPISRTQLISYRMASIVSSAMIKATCFSIVMIPDLNVWAFGLIGMFLGLLFVDLIRVGFELLFHGLSKRGQVVCRTLVVGGFVSCLGWALFCSLFAASAASNISSPGSLLFFKHLVGELVALATTSSGEAMLLPFKAFGQLILGDSFSMQTLGLGVLSVAMVLIMAVTVYRLDRWAIKRTLVKEKLAFEKSSIEKLTKAKTSTPRKRVNPSKRNRNPDSQQNSSARTLPTWLSGATTLAWRQFRGAYHYRMTVALSLGIPTALCCIPLLAKHEPLMMLMNIVAGLVFYSFLLLPSALILDFRRDVERFAMLKSLPISPLAATLGQLAAPVVICWMFQWTVLAIAVGAGGVVAWHAIIAGLLLLPVNTLIFAIENFAFMLAPYRRNREGIDVFLRTILTFTGKGVLFAVALVGVLAWAFASKAIAGAIGWPTTAGAIFGVGAWSMTLLVATGFVLGISRMYARMDPSEIVV